MSFTLLARRAPFANTIVVLGEGGKILEQGSFDDLKSQRGYLSSTFSQQSNQNLSVNIKSKSEEGVSTILTETARLLDAALPTGVKQGDLQRRDGDTSIYKFYLKSAGWLSPSIIIAMMTILAFCDGFSSKPYFLQSLITTY